jgi:hypothetical protein
MLKIDRPDDIVDAEFVDLDESAGVELVALAQPSPVSPRPAPRPNSTFVAHLIATADRDPQTRLLRRGSPADAQTAYGAGQTLQDGAAPQTRQTI